MSSGNLDSDSGLTFRHDWITKSDYIDAPSCVAIQQKKTHTHTHTKLVIQNAAELLWMTTKLYRAFSLPWSLPVWRRPGKRGRWGDFHRESGSRHLSFHRETVWCWPQLSPTIQNRSLSAPAPIPQCNFIVVNFINDGWFLYIRHFLFWSAYWFIYYLFLLIECILGRN